MKYEIGDTILVLHSNEEGKVVEFIDDTMIMIEVEGIQFPVYMDQIDFPYFKLFSEKKLFEKPKEKIYVDNLKKEKEDKHKVAKGAWLSFLPVFSKDVFDDSLVEKCKLYLINQTEVAYNFTYHLFINGKNDFQLKNQIEPFADFYLHDIQFEDLSNNPRFDIEFSLLEENKKKAPYFETSVKLKPKQLFKKIEELQLKNEPTFAYILFEKYPDKIKEEKFEMVSNSIVKIYDASKARENLELPRTVIDLHIEKLTDSWKHLSNFEILTIQLKTFEKYYELAVAHYQPSLTVIHGVGIGKLKNEIHDILKNKSEVKSFVNQYNPNYGYGATEIYFGY
jgi:hypothetical protein